MSQNFQDSFSILSEIEKTPSESADISQLVKNALFSVSNIFRKAFYDSKGE